MKSELTDHVHQWRQPEPDFSSRLAILFSITGAICDCGAMRIYDGPLYGWVLIEIDPAVKTLKPGGILSSADLKDLRGTP